MTTVDNPTGTAASGKATAAVRDSVKTVIAASMVGTAIEFYDFYAYGTAAANYFPTGRAMNATANVTRLSSSATVGLVVSEKNTVGK